jgi:hypothetical protein
MVGKWRSALLVSSTVCSTAVSGGQVCLQHDAVIGARAHHGLVRRRPRRVCLHHPAGRLRFIGTRTSRLRRSRTGICRLNLALRHVVGGAEGLQHHQLDGLPVDAEPRNDASAFHNAMISRTSLLTRPHSCPLGQMTGVCSGWFPACSRAATLRTLQIVGRWSGGAQSTFSGRAYV